MKTDAEMVRQLMGDRIKAKRKKLRIKQTDFADMLSITRASVNNIEAGRQNLTVDRLIDFADALQCDLSDLLPRIR